MASFPACNKIFMITLATTLLLVVSTISAFPIDKKDGFKQNAFDIVRKKVENAIHKETRMGASLIRLHFHDCFVNGCDGSVLLDNTTRTNGEKFAPPNLNSARGFDVIDDIKKDLEAKLPGVVSCADILAIAARDAVNILGGPYWNATTGRLDSKKASQNDAKNGIPAPSSDIRDLIKKFDSLGLTTRDLVALSGAHTVGLARCTNFRARIYNKNSTINRKFAQERQRDCPRVSGKGDNNMAPLDPPTQNTFDNMYYINLVKQKGLLHSDQQLFSGGLADSKTIVQEYADNQKIFFSDFASAMIKMGGINTLTGSNGEIRKDCRKTN